MTKKSVCILLLLLCVLAWSGCGDKAVETELTTKALLADYDALWEALETDYVFFPVLRQQGIDLEQVRENYRQKAAGLEPEVGDFYTLLERMFSELGNFAHLSMVDSHTYEICQQAYNSQDAGPNGWRTALQNKRTQEVYTELAGKDGAEGLPDSFPEVECGYDEGRRAVTFRIPSFDASLLQRDRCFVEDYLRSLGGVPIDHIIFDITGNGGGHTGYWRDNIVAPFGGSYDRDVFLYYRDTELTRSYISEDMEPQPIGRLPESHPAPEFVSELGLTRFIREQYTETFEATLSGDALTAKRWVLINERVYSAADSFASFCKETGWATLVGTRTKGDGDGIPPVLVTLPNTGLLVRFSAVTGENSEGRLNALYGTAPDVPSSRYEAPITTLHRAMEEAEE